MSIDWKNIHPRADIRRSQLENNGAGLGDFPATFAERFYVDTNHNQAANGANKGTSKDKPFSTIAFAVTQLDEVDQVIYVMPGHTETVSAADAWKIAKAGAFIIGLGTGTRRPTITFDTVTTATILMDLAGIVFSGLRFVVGVDSLVTMIDMSLDGCRILDCEFIQDDSSTQALVAITLSNVASDRCKILGCAFEASSAGAASAINIGAALNDLEIGGCYAFGDYTDACIQNPTANVATNLNIRDCLLANLSTGNHSIQLVSACTGFLVRNMYHNDMTQATGVNPGSCFSFECYHDDVIDTSGIIAPVIT